MRMASSVRTLTSITGSVAITLAVAVVLTVWSFAVYIHRYRDLFSTTSSHTR